jgi:hypothetical protein
MPAGAARLRPMTDRPDVLRMRLLPFCSMLAVALCCGGAQAQDARPKVWDIKLGTPVAALPIDEFVDPACGTNGGPPSRTLSSFADFARCPFDRTTGLHEVWFRYDDELEYIARARRSDLLIREYQANALAGQPIITSLLIDDAGLVQGYRIVNDPRADPDLRLDAYGLADLFKGIVGSGLTCNDLPPAPGERPIEDFFVKQVCERRADGEVTRIESRRYYKPGQYAVDPNDSHVTQNEFESSARMEVYRPATAAK